MNQYTQYLAANVLNDGRIINYRLLSRALKVHNTLSKQMLYEFHRTQNAKRPSSVHATYLVIGRKRRQTTHNGVHIKNEEDMPMESSPIPSSLPVSESEQEVEQIPTTSVTLVKEENLEEISGQYEEIQSVFIYSLAPASIQDYQILSECNHKVATEYVTDDPLTAWKQYGVIQNPNVRRRPTRQHPQVTSSASTVTSSKAAAPKVAPAKSEKQNETKKPLSSTIATKSTSELSKKTGSTKPPIVRRQSSNISSMLAKANPPKPKSAGISAAATPSAAGPTEDSPMKDVSEDEGNDDDFVMVDDTKTEEALKARKKREERLREMMDTDDEMKDAPSESVDELQQETETDLDASQPIDVQPKKQKEEEKEQGEGEEGVKVEGGRRRGRRKVMKKKTVQDEDGFLVTTEEPAWESFSEEEPEPKKVRMQQPSTASKGKKGMKQGQGNIMSFFKKG